MAARRLRYRWFEQIMREYGYDTLVTAHHADDNLETFLINLSRGTGLDGLTGIPEKTDSLARPLLIFPRNLILKYARSNKLEWREDGSNSDTKYLRNKIRHELVPRLKELHPTFLENFDTTLKNLKGSESILENHVKDLKKRLFVEKDGVVSISIKKMVELHPIEPYIYELFKDYGFTAWADINALLNAPSGKEVFSKTHRLLKDREHLLLKKLEDSSDSVENFSLHENVKELKHPVNLTFETVERFQKGSDSNILYCDKKTLKYPLTVRKWREGDYFYPLGMKGKKKLSKYFKDEKMDVISKENQWLLCSDDQVVWIIGKRADERFKVTDSTIEIQKITLN